LVTSTIEPVSATARLAPVMPTSAWRKAVPQPAAGEAHELGGLGPQVQRSGHGVDEQVLDLVAVAVQGGAMMWARGLARELDDPLAQVGLVTSAPAASRRC
jgi:hypothetical protein